MTHFDSHDWAAFMDALVSFSEAVEAWARSVCDALVDMLDALDAAREARREHGRTGHDMRGKPRSAKVMTGTAPMVWRWTWTPMYGRR